MPQEKPTQERLLRSQVAEAEAAAEAGKGNVRDLFGYIIFMLILENYILGDEAEAEEEKEIDAYDLAEPVDVLSKMSKDFYTLLVIYVI